MADPAAPGAPIWDIFCRVVDNFGDIGICWRLGRQLVAEHGIRVRLWVDATEALARLRGQDRPLPWEPHGLVVRPWDEAAGVAAPGTVVIEAFACELPSEFVESMAHQNKAPLWINLEYLSAEDWIEGCHGLPSPHPHWPLGKVFFFPGFTERSGGLLREATLLAERDAFQGAPQARQDCWRGLGGAGGWDQRFNLSLFAYEVPELPSFLEALAGGEQPVRLLVPEGRTVPDVLAWFGRASAGPGDTLAAGALEVALLPFLTQPDYDRLLWACDFNVVRGEDSFLRAQWAGRPFVWHVYRQSEDAHLVKLEAFQRRYLAGAPPELAAAATNLALAWNQDRPLGDAWASARACLPAWTRHALDWSERLARQSDLARRLVEFANS